ncbi:MAG: nitroreductase family protein [Bacillota bacterium]
MKQLLKVNLELCSKCGTCAEVCPRGIIRLGSAGPKMLLAAACLSCGHCVAVCPKGALEHQGFPQGEEKPLPRFPVLDPETAEAFLRSRRSIRCYKKEAVPREKLRQLLEIARFAPSGGNSQGLSYRVVDDRDLLKKITAATIDWMEGQIKDGAEWAKGYGQMISEYRKTGIDSILRNAPCLILATAPCRFPLGRDNARLSLEYVELYATTLGLGTCWAGFVEMCAGAGYPPLLQIIRLPEEMAVVGAMMTGYPRYTYRRLVERNPLQISWV